MDEQTESNLRKDFKEDVKDLKRDMQTSFADLKDSLTRSVEQLVSRGEFVATIARFDNENRALHKRVDDLKHVVETNAEECERSTSNISGAMWKSATLVATIVGIMFTVLNFAIHN